MKILLAFLTSSLILAGCSNAAEDSQPASESLPSIVTGSFAVAWLASSISDGCAVVTDLAPSGGDAHDLELTASQTASILDADLVIPVDGLQPAFDAVAESKSSGVFDILDLLDPLTAEDHADEDGHADHADEDGHADHADEDGHADHADEDGHEDHADEDGHEDHGLLDPHFWLDPKRVSDAAGFLGAEISKLSADCATKVEVTVPAVQAQLEDLTQEFETSLATCSSRTIVVSHEAFGYLADAFNLEQIGVAGLDPEGEPSAARLKEVIDLANSLGVSAVFTESTVNPDVAQTLADALEVGILTLDPLEIASVSKDYISLMQTNLEALRSGLNCS
jgi:zinc transport system substrate-binding protein